MDPPSAAPGRRPGLVVPVPVVEPVVGGWRAQLDPSARYGMPAHVTVLFPWFRLRDLAPQVVTELASVAADRLPFDVTFNRVAQFPETLWLAPTPGEPLVELTEAVRRSWPEYPPFDGRFDAVIPHLTIGDGIDPADHRHVIAAIEANLPVRARVGELTLMAQDAAGRWSVHSTYPFSRLTGAHQVVRGRLRRGVGFSTPLSRVSAWRNCPPPGLGCRRPGDGCRSRGW